jgi:hypothetical protein
MNANLSPPLNTLTHYGEIQEKLRVWPGCRNAEYVQNFGGEASFKYSIGGMRRKF